MNSVMLGATFLMVVVMSSVLAWPYEDEYSAWRLARSSRRSHSCVGSGGKCYSTTQCCKRFVCAAFDDYYAAKPEVPGLCVKEKDLKPCYSYRDCGGINTCVPLGRNGETYCVDKDDDQEPNALPSIQKTTGGSGTGRIGSVCQTSSDCQNFHKDGTPMCCQSVKLGRQGRKVMCDRVTELSSCRN